METGTIKDIQNYLGECEFPCTSCGSINTLEELIVQLDNNRAKATCAHCETFIKWLPAKKIDRVFWKGNMTEIAKIETSLLMWMVNNQFGSHSARRFIRIELMTRVDASEVPDIQTDRAEERELANRTKLRKEQNHLLHLTKIEQQLILDNWETWDTGKMEHSERLIVKWKQRVEFLEKKLKTKEADPGGPCLF